MAFTKVQKYKYGKTGHTLIVRGVSMYRGLFSMDAIRAVKQRNENLYLTSFSTGEESKQIIKLWIADRISQDVSGQMDELTRQMVQYLTEKLLEHDV